MNRYQSFTIKTVLVLVICLFTSVAYASSPKVSLDGEEMIFDVPPVLDNGRVLVPLRAIFEALNATVSWDEKTQTVTANRNEIRLELKVGQNIAYKNGQQVKLDVPTKIINNRTMVPLRFVSESLGASVNWDAQIKTVFIYTTIHPTLLTTIDINFPSKWYNTLSDKLPTVQKTETVYKEQLFYIPLFFSNYARDTQNNVNIEYDLKILDPSGKVYLDTTNLEGAKFQKEELNLILGTNYTVMYFKPEDKFGSYKIQVIVRDLVAKQSTKVERELRLVEYQNKQYFTKPDELLNFVLAYHKNPQPDKLVDAFRVYNEYIKRTGKNDEAFDMFFAESFAKNQFLLKHIPQPEQVNPELMEFIKAYINRYADPHPYKMLNLGKPQTIDEMYFLWGQFFASGSYEPAYNLVSGLEYSDKFDDFKHNDEPYGSMSSDAKLGMLYKLTKEHLESVMKENQLLRDYCKYIVKYETIGSSVKADLDSILKRVQD